MAHNSTTITTVSPTAASWSVSAGTMSVAQWKDLSRKLAQSVNGVNGSTHAPSAQIVIGGSGLQVKGPTVIQGEGVLETLSSGLVSHQDGDFPQLAAGHAGRTKTILTNGLKGWCIPWWSARPALAFGGFQANWMQVTNSAGAVIVPQMYVPLDVLDGAPFSSVTVTFRVSSPHTGLPTTMPKFAVLQLDQDGNATPITSTAPGANSSGFVSVTKPTSAQAWYNAGNAQSLTLPIDSGTTADLSNYAYVLAILDELGAPGGFQVAQKADVDAAYTTNTALTGLPAGVSAGQRVLLAGQTDATTNGIYIAASGAWSRSSDCQAPTDFSANFIVQVKVGGITPLINNLTTFFQYTGASPPQANGSGIPYTFTVPLTFSYVKNAPPLGTIVCSAACTFAPTQVGY